MLTFPRMYTQYTFSDLPLHYSVKCIDQHFWIPIQGSYTQRRVQPDQCYFTVQITGLNFGCSL